MKNKKTIIIIIAVILTLLVLGGAGFYFYNSKQDTSKNDNKTEVKDGVEYTLVEDRYEAEIENVLDYAGSLLSQGYYEMDLSKTSSNSTGESYETDEAIVAGIVEYDFLEKIYYAETNTDLKLKAYLPNDEEVELDLNIKLTDGDVYFTINNINEKLKMNNIKDVIIYWNYDVFSVNFITYQAAYKSYFDPYELKLDSLNDESIRKMLKGIVEQINKEIDELEYDFYKYDNIYPIGSNMAISCGSGGISDMVGQIGNERYFGNVKIENDYYPFVPLEYADYNYPLIVDNNRYIYKRIDSGHQFYEDFSANFKNTGIKVKNYLWMGNYGYIITEDNLVYKNIYEYDENTSGFSVTLEQISDNKVSKVFVKEGQELSPKYEFVFIFENGNVHKIVSDTLGGICSCCR